jgi:hypothetical protein
MSELDPTRNDAEQPEAIPMSAGEQRWEQARSQTRCALPRLRELAVHASLASPVMLGFINAHSWGRGAC